MKLVIFGLSVSSSWGNGHATLWRGLCAALARRGHRVVFFERDAPWYASSRDMHTLPGGGELILYSEWDDAQGLAKAHVGDADVAMVTSYCPDAIAASNLVREGPSAMSVFYDLDAPITLWQIAHGEPVEYVGPGGYRDFDLVLSYTGGKTLGELRRVLGATRVAPLYGSVDPDSHKRTPPDESYAADLSYMGTWSADRDEALRMRFIEPARQLPHQKFLLAGSQYGNEFSWLPNIYFISHLPPDRHSAFYCSSRLTLNVTRGPMAAMGYCPSGRLFEAAACGVPILSDYWQGLEQFYEPGAEILIADSTDEALAAIAADPAELTRIGNAGRIRTLACHTADARVLDLESLLSAAPEPVEAEVLCGA